MRGMRLGVTGRSRTGTGGVTARSSDIELRPHPSARGDSPQADAARLGPALDHVTLVLVRQSVGERAHLDCSVLRVDLDGQQTIDPVLRAPPQRPDRPIGDKLARQIESTSGKPSGWLDEVRKDSTPSAAEAASLELALTAWRSTNSAGRKALRDHLKTIVAS